MKECKHVIYLIPGLATGGTERQLIQHLQYLTKNHNYTFEVVTINKPIDAGSLRDQIPKTVKVTEYSCHDGLTFKTLKTIYNHFKKSRPDIVVSSAFIPNTLSRILKIFFWYKTVAREHNVYPERTLIHRFINFILYKIATDYYVAVSVEAAKAAEKSAWLKPNSVTVIENGIDQVEWLKRKESLSKKQDIKSELGLNEDTKIILTISRLTSKKRINLLLKAFDIFAKMHPDYVLLVVGYGHEENKLKEQLSQLACHNRVHFLGRQDQVERFYAIADIYALTSAQEGFPNVLLEALFFGLPMVATFAPGVPRVVVNDKIGYIVDADPHSVAAGFERVTKWSKEQKSFAKEEAKMYSNNFFVEKIVTQYIKLYDRL